MSCSPFISALPNHVCEALFRNLSAVVVTRQRLNHPFRYPTRDHGHRSVRFLRVHDRRVAAPQDQPRCQIARLLTSQHGTVRPLARPVATGARREIGFRQTALDDESRLPVFLGKRGGIGLQGRGKAGECGVVLGKSVQSSGIQHARRPRPLPRSNVLPRRRRSASLTGSRCSAPPGSECRVDHDRARPRHGSVHNRAARRPSASPCPRRCAGRVHRQAHDSDPETCGAAPSRRPPSGPPRRRAPARARPASA